MKGKSSLVIWQMVGLLALGIDAAGAEHHRATRLGGLATRFAPPLATPEDLRARFRDPQLKPDIASVLDQWGWKGNLDDLHRAAQTHPIAEVSIPVGHTMPFMSSRERGKPVCLRQVLWAGKEPISAYAFTFASNGRRYRCVTPKPCSNFFLEDLGDDDRHQLALDCSAPEQMVLGCPVRLCMTLRNAGNVIEPKTTLALPAPAGGRIVSASDPGVVTEAGATWEISNLAPNATRQICAVVAADALGSVSFQPSARGTKAGPVQSACRSKVIGVPAILLEVGDLEDPIEIGKEVTYEIRVTNQGTADGTNIRLVCRLPASQEYVSGSGATPIRASAGVLEVDPYPSLASKARVSWRIVTKALRADDARFRVELSSDQFNPPINEVESTQQY
ncbi:MAG TPA: hypothetical protein P5555_18160 [Candidatus Paceibacterota bacterium]|nr:hypothetical protein [Verrucomicrobiota bacterium]HRZ47107.1 hypothetical protein [Candidatus Paceibacterota bacterium]HRZ92151.1 hypothetical protein [Candidatus Paceibacterota bacterium]